MIDIHIYYISGYHHFIVFFLFT